MLTKLIIKNFQAHSQLQIQLSPTCTTFIGRTDVGKSSIIRAIRWLAHNRPIGMDFLRWGEERVSVGIEIDGKKLRHSKNKKAHHYIIDTEIYKAFGSGVPAEVTDLLRLDDLNFQQQHDQPFWFFLTPGQVGKNLNEIVNLQVIDNTLANLDKKVRNAKATLEVCNTRKKTAAEELAGFLDVDELQTEANNCQFLEQAAKEKRARAVQLEKAVSYCKSATKLASAASALAATAKAALQARKRADALASVVVALQTAAKQTAIVGPDFVALKAALENTKAAKKRAKELADCISRIKEAKQQKKQVDEWLQEQKTQLQCLKERSVCPTCLRQF